MPVVVALCKCSNTDKLYGIRLEKQGKDWLYTWAFPINEKRATKEKYDKTKITGRLIHGEEYPGCPHCYSRDFFACGACGKLTCWDGHRYTVTCQWCGNKGELSGQITNLDVSGNI